jgi:hypothetical protein
MRHREMSSCHRPNSSGGCGVREWQPIETAPRDGTLIDVWHVCIDPTWRPGGEEMRYTDVKWMTSDEGHGWHSYDEIIDDWRLLCGEPHYRVTHWMPTPTAPQTEEDAA